MHSSLSLHRPELLRQHCFINGQWRDAISGETFSIRNPATQATIGTVPRISPDEITEAIQIAETAFHAWRTFPAKQRALLLYRWAEGIMASQEDLAQIMTAEQGKPLAEARGEIAYAASFIYWFAEEAKRVEGDILPSPLSHQRLMVLKQPIGVCAAITPWNFPAAMITRKVAPALAAGCSIIVKPAEQTPLTALALAYLAQEAGIPTGVLQIVTGEAKTLGAVLCASPTVRKLSFTGSTEVGRILMQQCAPTIKKLSLELGGNAPFIVFEDANLEAAVQGIIASKFRNSGQTCVCANRIYIQSSIYEALSARLVEAVQDLRVGDGTQEGVTQGPLIDQAAVQKVHEHIQDAVSKGANILIGGQPHALGGFFFQPSVITHVTQQMRFAREETFGPVAPLFRFEQEEDVIQMANDTEFGLAAYFYTRHAARQWRVAEALEYGMIGINTGMISNEIGPFGGVKQSGLGREGSRYGIDEYLEMKYMCLDITD